MESSAIGAELFLFGAEMEDIYTAAIVFCKLTDIEYRIILGRKGKTLELSIFFEKPHFYHLAGLHHLKDLADFFKGEREKIFEKIINKTISQKDLEISNFYPLIRDRIKLLSMLESIMDSNKTVYKYNPNLEAFSSITADFLLKNEIQNRNIFTFLSKDYKSGNYFCRSFFPQIDKDYSKGQTNWTLLYKKKINKSTKSEEILFNKLSV